MQEAEKIITKAKKAMQPMLNSVLKYNSGFILNKESEKLLNRSLFAMSVIDRKHFCEKEKAYSDSALLIGENQTISQPSTVSRMFMLADLKAGEDVLEAGTGSGWNAVLMAFLVYPGNLVSIEKLEKLKQKAENNLASLRGYLKINRPEIYEKLRKINFLAESLFDRKTVWKKKYDKIMITAGINPGQEGKIEKIAKELLKQGGRLICPYISGPMLVYEKHKKLVQYKTKEKYIFVPLVD